MGEYLSLSWPSVQETILDTSSQCILPAVEDFEGLVEQIFDFWKYHSDVDPTGNPNDGTQLSTYRHEDYSKDG